MRLYKNEGKNTIDFSGELTFSFKDYGVEMIEGYDGNVAICNRRVFHLNHKKWKISRFIYATLVLWKNI